MPAEAGTRILVVDDEEDLTDTLREILARSGYDVEIAYSAEQAIERAGRHDPEVVVMDMRLADASGVETFREIKALVPDACGIFMTGYSDPALFAEAARAGVPDVLAKPFEIPRLLELVGACRDRCASSA